MIVNFFVIDDGFAIDYTMDAQQDPECKEVLEVVYKLGKFHTPQMTMRFSQNEKVIYRLAYSSSGNAQSILEKLQYTNYNFVSI
jgi:hypothetical protein